jgi:hypothetical protein
MSRIDSLTQIRVRLTHATTQVSPTSLERIRQAWAGVPMKIIRESNSNVAQANENVQGLVDELAARGETTSHLLNDLFEGHKAASDKEFVKYVKTKQQEHNDGDTPIEAAKLMHLASNF